MSSTAETVFYRYPPRRLLADYLRAVAGLAFGLAILLATKPSTAGLLIFGALTLVFAGYGLRTLRQHVLRVAVTSEGIFAKGLGTRALAWSELGQIKLRYFGTRRERKHSSGGFMQLTLKGGGQAMTFESSIEGFRDIVWHAAKASRRNGVPLDPTTAGNLLGIGIPADEDTPRPGDGESERTSDELSDGD